VITLNVINRILQIFQICHILIGKNVAMRAGLNVEEWSGEISQGDDLLLNFIELVAEFHSLSHWVGHLLQRVQLTAKVGEMVLAFYFVNWVVQLPKVCHVLLNLSKVLVLSFHARVDRTLKRFQVSYLCLNLLELVGAVNIVDGALEAFHIIEHPFHLGKLICMPDIVNGTS